MYTLVWGKKKGTEGNKDNKRDNREHWGQREAKGEREKKREQYGNKEEQRGKKEWYMWEIFHNRVVWMGDMII